MYLRSLHGYVSKTTSRYCREVFFIGNNTIRLSTKNFVDLFHFSKGRACFSIIIKVSPLGNTVARFGRDDIFCFN